jgi:peptidoglycan/LPS O-acetylase OafA/YrhL
MTAIEANAPRGSGYRPDIDGLRAVSVTAVLLHHLGATWMPGGFIGVDVFFVISGFLITGIIARESDEGRFSYLTFYERRIRRIYPALLLVLIVTAVLAWLLFVPLELRYFGRSLSWTPLFASNFVFMGQTGYFDPDGATKPLLHTWSLGVEEQYYIVFPLLLFGAARFSIDRVKLVGGLVVISFLASVVSGVLGYADAYFLLPMRLWELGAGALLALRPLDRASEKVRSGLGVIGLGLIVLALFRIDESMAFPGWVAAVPVVGATLVLASGVGPAARLLATAPFTFIGRISYPMYLWHWPLIVFTQVYFFHPVTPIEGVAIAVATVLLSWGTLVWLETPIRSRGVLARRSWLFATAGVVSLAVVVVGIATFSLRNFERWTTSEQVAIAAVRREGTVIGEVCPGVDEDIVGERKDCLIGAVEDPSKPISFALLGDSHSYATGGALASVAKAMGRKGIYLGKSGCPPFFGIDQTVGDNPRCAANVKASLAQIKALSSITDVVIVSRWAWTITGHDYARSPSRIHAIRYNGRTLGEVERWAVLEKSLEETLDVLSDRRVHLMTSTPEIKFDVTYSIANAMRLGRPIPLGPLRSEHELRQSTSRALLEQAVKGRAWVELIDPTDTFCDAERCTVLTPEGPLYMDSDHVSRLGAKRLAPLFAAMLSRPTTEASSAAGAPSTGVGVTSRP